MEHGTEIMSAYDKGIYKHISLSQGVNYNNMVDVPENMWNTSRILPNENFRCTDGHYYVKKLIQVRRLGLVAIIRNRNGEYHGMILI